MDIKTVSGLVFVAVFLLVLGLDQLKAPDRQLVNSRIKKITTKDIKKRLSGLSQTEHKELWRKMLSAASELFIARRLGQLMDKKLEEADVPLSGKEFVVIVTVCGAGAGLFATAFTLSFRAGILTGLAGGMLPFLMLSGARAKRLANFNAQIGDALTIMANSMRSGFSFLQSMDMVSRELPNPIKKEFTRTFQEVNLGTSTEDALLNMAKRVNSPDLDLVITAVLIQRQVGGNLAEVLDNIAGTVRERISIKRQVKTLTAQGRISGIVIGLLPVLLCGFMFATQPSYIMELFTNRIGMLMLTAAVMGEVIGMLLIKKIVNIRF
jgi:tight adherence protein B